MPNYKNSKIYKLCNNIDNLIYIGSTTGPLCMCMAVHHTEAKKNNNANLYKHMNKLGVQNFKIILIENYACASKDELLKRERYYIEIHDKNILLNLNRPIINSIEKKQLTKIWNTKNKKYYKIWHAKNKEYQNEQNGKWHLNNKLHFKIYKQKYHQFNILMQELPFYRVPLTISF